MPKKLHYVTGNKNKFANAKAFFDTHTIEIVQSQLPIYEIQSSDSMEIAQSKIDQAWNQLQEPLFINDACWIIPALNGFPGPYMKYINNWFVPQDFINLMQGKKDRTIILRDTIIYKDSKGSHVFTNDHKGEVLMGAYEGAFRVPSDVVISLSRNRKSIAEEISNKTFFLEGEDRVWINFVNWLKANK